jgi:hypothetical protein
VTILPGCLQQHAKQRARGWIPIVVAGVLLLIGEVWVTAASRRRTEIASVPPKTRCMWEHGGVALNRPVDICATHRIQVTAGGFSTGGWRIYQ